jgi:hypothetical protein
LPLTEGLEEIAFYQGDIYHAQDASPEDPDDCWCILTGWKGREVMRVLYGDMDLYLAPGALAIEEWFRRSTPPCLESSSKS